MTELVGGGMSALDQRCILVWRDRERRDVAVFTGAMRLETRHVDEWRGRAVEGPPHPITMAEPDLSMHVDQAMVFPYPAAAVRWANILKVPSLPTYLWAFRVPGGFVPGERAPPEMAVQVRAGWHPYTVGDVLRDPGIGPEEARRVAAAGRVLSHDFDFV